METTLTPVGDPRWRLFLRLWGIALVAHVVANWAQPDIPAPVGWANLAVGLAGVVLVVRAEKSWLLIASVLTVISVLLEIPGTGNHWVVAGLVSLAALATVGRSQQFFPAARLILLVFYSFAAFAKLNRGFFDPTVSCGVFYANQWLDGFGIGPLPPTSWADSLAIWGPALIELTIPVLLLWRRVRPYGVLAGTAFHTVISFDLNQHFFDFTAVLLPLFFLFTADDTAKRIDEHWQRVPPRTRRLAAIGLSGMAILLVLMAVVTSNSVSRSVLTQLPFLVWVPFSLWWLYGLIRFRAPGQGLSWSVRPAAALVVIITMLNGITPYTEVKTAYSYNMYANLVTAGGESNHFLIRRTWPLREGYQDPVRIIESSDPGLREYASRGYLIAYPEFRNYLVNKPDTSVTYTRGEARFTIERTGDEPGFSTPVPWWSRFLPLRSLDSHRPPRCQDVFLPAL